MKSLATLVCVFLGFLILLSPIAGQNDTVEFRNLTLIDQPSKGVEVVDKKGDSYSVNHTGETGTSYGQINDRLKQINKNFQVVRNDLKKNVEIAGKLLEELTYQKKVLQDQLAADKGELRKAADELKSTLAERAREQLKSDLLDEIRRQLVSDPDFREDLRKAMEADVKKRPAK